MDFLASTTCGPAAQARSRNLRRYDELRFLRSAQSKMLAFPVVEILASMMSGKHTSGDMA
jgi:hypothetical protein